MKKTFRTSYLFKVYLVCAFLLSSTFSLSAQISKKHILLIGMEKVDNISIKKKRGQIFDNEATKKAIITIDKIKEVVAKDGTNLIILTNELATKKNIVDTISYIGKNIHSGDSFILYFFGHGYQIPDKSNDEQDKLDEVLVVYDDFLIDDEINQLFERYFTKTKNLMLVDACHSGSSNKGYFDIKSMSIPDYNKDNNPAKLILAKNICELNDMVVFGEPYNLIYFGATNDNNTIKSYSGGGIIAYYLNQIMTEIRKSPAKLQKYTYRQLACDLSTTMSKQVGQKELQFHEFAKTRNDSSGIPFEFN